MPALRLSHKLFLAFTLIVGVVLSLAGWSLFTTRRLTVENRTIIQRALPSVRLEVKAFVMAHGGRVWVESEEGQGSCFTFTLPLDGAGA